MTRIEKKITHKILSTLPLMVLWFLFWEGNGDTWQVHFWNQLGLDITKEYDLFLFADKAQKIRWYAHYMAYFYTLYVLANCLYLVGRNYLSAITARIIFVFQVFCACRGIEYLLFRNQLGVGFIIAAVIIFSLYALNNGKRSVSV